MVRPIFLKGLLLFFGTLIGLSGLMSVAIGCLMATKLDGHSAMDIGFGIYFEAFVFTIGAYCLYACYLVWRRFSPLAVQHICGTIAFFSLGIPSRFYARQSLPLGLYALAPIVWFAVVYYCYKFGVRGLNRRLFPSPPTDPLTAAPPAAAPPAQ